MQQRENLLLLFVAILTAVICHFAFSPFGFNPTDEGFVLSSSVRLLHGQIPHVDFSTLRPMGYGYLHIPELLINHDYTFLISRFVFWLEMALIACFWILILNVQIRTELYPERSEGPKGWTRNVVLFLTSFIFNAHYFPIAVLHTIDGLLFAVIGFYILMRFEKLSWLAGLLIGYSVLCKQGFAVLLPLILFLFPKKKTAFVISFIPGVIYVSYISVNGGWQDMITQLTAHSEILEVGILNYVLNPFLFGGIIISLLIRKLRLPYAIAFWLFTFSLILLLVTNHYHGKALLLLFGFIVAEFFFETQNRKLYVLALALAWCVSISVGYASIALFSGGLLSLLIHKFVLSPTKDEHKKLISILFARSFSTSTSSALRVISLLTLVIITVFAYTRTTNIYRDSPRSQLTYKIDEVVEGANGIRTNKQTFTVLQELDSLLLEYPFFLALPDFTAVQIFNHNRLILTEWPNRAEVPNNKILNKITHLLKKDLTTIVALPKYQTAILKDSLTPINYEDYETVQFIKWNYENFNETKYFDLFKKPK